MAMNHLSKLWLEAEDELVEKVARRLAARHGAEIFGSETITPAFLNHRWRVYECDARDVIVEVRCFDRHIPSQLDERDSTGKEVAAKWEMG